ncbi:MAG TPA: Hsp20/alpha crystallin family protein [Candidatus Binataceae bacterium]|nr:Hsp20/alpha crystallin family protein [Candidatus Binataceae bacterium]
MATRAGISVEEFERALDEFFDEMLISRWRRPPLGEFENAQVIEHHDRYELRISAPEVDQRLVEVEVTGQRLSVSAPGGPEGKFESSCSFALPIESETIEARWSNRTLIIIVPKQKPKRIKVSD